MEAKTGRIVAMASQPTYDPETWVGGITKKQLARLYSDEAGNPLLSRATQGQFAPGSTWKPIMTVGALNNGFTPDTRLDCSSGLQVGNRWFKNYESASYGSIGFDQALQLSCDTFFYRVGLSYWQRYGSDPQDVDAKDPLVDEAKDFGFGSRDRDRPARRGHRPDRRPALEARLLEVHEVLLLQDRQGRLGHHRLPARLRPRVLPRGQLLPRRRRRELLDRAGRHDRHAAPARPRVRRALQRRHALRAAGGQGDRQPGRQDDQEDQAEGRRARSTRRPRACATSTRRSRARRRSARSPGSSPTSRSTRSRSAARPAPPRSTASSRRRGSRRTTRTTWS